MILFSSKWCFRFTFTHTAYFFAFGQSWTTKWNLHVVLRVRWRGRWPKIGELKGFNAGLFYHDSSTNKNRALNQTFSEYKQLKIKQKQTKTKERKLCLFFDINNIKLNFSVKQTVVENFGTNEDYRKESPVFFLLFAQQFILI